MIDRRLWFAAAMVAAWAVIPASSAQQTNLLNEGCSQYNATNRANFFFNRNQTFSDLRRQLSGGAGEHFATAQHARSSDPVYALAQCRDYLSTRDCVSCFDAAVQQILNCSAANGARVIFDGCFLRYESNTFYDQTTLPGNTNLCGNQTAPQPTAFTAAVRGLLADLQIATPMIKGYFAASKREATGANATVYGVAQCAESVSQNGCQDCLTVAYGNLQNCAPNTEGRAVDAGCFLRYSASPFFADNQTVDISPFLVRAGGSRRKHVAVIAGVIGGVGLVLLVTLVIFFVYQLSEKPKARQRGDLLGATELRGPTTYSYKDLKTATKNFSEETKLGEGGFGDVYKGSMKNGTQVAVKKLDISSGSAKADFDSEVRLISNVHHRNVIRLLGCSTKGPELLLVYEYMENGSLDKYLYGEKKVHLNWKQRFDIIFGTARGLAYLHEHFHVCIIHRDIKPSNILLDNYFQPKIADFGLARLLPEDKTHLSTKFAGTLGYTAPEYAIHGQLSEKADTYSFGVVVLEIISGRRSSDVKSGTEVDFLLERAWKLYEINMHLELVDGNLDPNEYTPEEAKKIIELALVCTQSPASLRRMMSEVVLLLSEGTIEQKPTSRPAFIGSDEKRIRGDTTSTTTTSSATSNATASFTEFCGR